MKGRLNESTHFSSPDEEWSDMGVWDMGGFTFGPWCVRIYL